MQHIFRRRQVTCSVLVLSIMMTVNLFAHGLLDQLSKLS